MRTLYLIPHFVLCHIILGFTTRYQNKVTLIHCYHGQWHDRSSSYIHYSHINFTNTTTGPAQGKGGVQSQDSHAMVQEYFVFVFCMSSIYHVIRFWPFLESSLLNMTHNVGQLLVMIIYYKIKDMTLHFKCHKRLTCSSDTSLVLINWKYQKYLLWVYVLCQ